MEIHEVMYGGCHFALLHARLEIPIPDFISKISILCPGRARYSSERFHVA